MGCNEYSYTTNRTVFICGIDAVKEKNLHQLRGLQELGYKFIVLTADSTGNSVKVVENVPDVQLYKSGGKFIVLSMLRHAIRILWKHRPSVVEIYPYSHFSFVVALLCRLLGFPVLLVARGEELKYVKGQMTAVRRIFFRGTYALASGVIYKELYMPKMLNRMNKHVRWHLPNAIKLPDISQGAKRTGCTFLYMNSVKPFRHPELCLEAFMRMCERQGFNKESDVRLIIVGLSGAVSSPKTSEKEKRLVQLVEGRDVPVELHDWTNDPSVFLQTADVFLLPADVVYVNYALLEAMGREIPAIVLNAPGADKLITNGIEGYIEGMDVEAWERRMSELAADATLRKRMGRSARQKVASDYELGSYISRYSQIYDHYMCDQASCPAEFI